MKKMLQFTALAVLCLSATVARSQSEDKSSRNYADQVISSTGVINPQNAVDINHTNYAIIRADIGVLNFGRLAVGFSSPGSGGQSVEVELQNDNGLLGADVLESISITVFDSQGNTVANKNGFAVADAQIIEGTSRYKIGLKTKDNVLDISSVKIRVSGLASIENRVRIYNVYLINTCPLIRGDMVHAQNNVQNANNAVSSDKDDFALLTPPLVLGDSYLDISFPSPGQAGKKVSFYLGEGNTILSATLLQNITLTVYNTNGDVVVRKSGFALADAKVLPDGRFILNVNTPKGDYQVGRGRITFTGLVNVLTTLKVYQIVGHKDCSVPQVQNAIAGNNTISAIDLQVAPNPFNAYTTLNIKNVLKNPAYITISDKAGNVVETHQLTGASSIRLLQNVSPGVYFVKIASGNSVETRKVIKL